MADVRMPVFHAPNPTKHSFSTALALPRSALLVRLAG